MANTSGKGGFKKGQSGNPTGRPKEFAHVRDLARVHTTEAIDTLATIMRDKEENGRSRAAAAEVLLSRGWGKPAQPLTGEDGGPMQFQNLPDEQVNQRIVELLADRKLMGLLNKGISK